MRHLQDNKKLVGAVKEASKCLDRLEQLERMRDNKLAYTPVESLAKAEADTNLALRELIRKVGEIIGSNDRRQEAIRSSHS